ncbi:VWA domain-containing protein [Clostridium swellfunianum]|uniref:VWA domain-containing protein n=1 Tax=Clostridium swellfunianum TaxID=1367462 RepID=UPI00202F36B5|nr:VWA domain-containing protein [Clostridium swellfunianum]MCM0650311.1 VWA domain-containing protein [Clostridium swellfunianum]
MSLEILRPYAFIIIPLAILFIAIMARFMIRMTRKKKVSILIFRVLVFTFLALALAGISIKWTIDTTTTMFVVDASDSTSMFRETAERFIREALPLKTKKDKTGVITFGSDSLIEQFISKNNTFSKLETKPVGTYTNIENGLTTALSLLPQNNKKRVVLITDGEENEGSAYKIAPSLLEQNIDFKVFKIEKAEGNEVAVESVTIPEKINLGDEFTIVTNITSTLSTSAKVTLYSGRDKRGEQEVQLQKGNNKFVFKDTADAGGFKSYKVVVEPASDTELKNNEYSSFTNVQDKPRILLIEDKSGEASELEKMLIASKMDYKKINAAAAPRNIEELNQYKTIITCNVHIDSLNKGFLNAMEPYVKDFAGGFIATGGDEGFILGEYLNSPLEKVLPVYMDMRGKKSIPEMGLVLVIDRSGSMDGGNQHVKKIDLAKDAALKAADTLRDIDEIGVIAFDDQVEWAVKRQKAENRNDIKNKIGNINIRGGTTILPSLAEAYKSLKDSKTKIKHIILLTDGQAENTGYDPLIEKLKQEKITVSTVAVGKDSDTKLLQGIAKKAGGRYYYTDENTNIPRIFAKEIFMAASVYLNEREFTPVLNSNHQILNGVLTEEKLPNLFGYVGSSPKETARMILRSDEEDPILSVWQYGLGKTVAWNSDISGKWSRNYINWDKNLKLWQNIINYTVENYGDESGHVEVKNVGSKGEITLETKNAGEDLSVTAVVMAPDSTNKEIKLNPSSPGKYTGSFDMKETGVYMVNVRQNKGEHVLGAINSAVALQYSPEYKIATQSRSNLDKMLSEMGVSYIKSPSEVFAGELKEVSSKTNLTPYFLTMALILFFFDIVIRKLNLSIKDLYKKKVKNEETVMVQSNIKDKSLQPQTSDQIQTMKTDINKDKKEKKKEDDKLDTNALLNKKKNRYF